MATKPLEPHMWSLEDLFDPSIIYSVPVYQRPYSWDKDQVSILLEDLIKEFESESKNDGYYTGNLIVYDNNENINGLISKYDIIDGQQRITTFSLIFLAIYCLAKENNIEDTDLTLSNVKKSLWKSEKRDFKKEYRAVNLNSIEKKCFEVFFDKCFDSPKDIIEHCQTYKCNSKFDERIINNFKIIYSFLNTRIFKNSTDNLLDFADYLLKNVQFIVITARCKENKVFSMFESINSKGKRLEEIDLIKTYIFSRLDESYYSKYLDIWGELIVRTKDNLYDYIYTYIKAYLSFYRQNIYIGNFKALCKKEMLTFFKTTNEAEALKALLDDLYNKVEYYNMLFSTENAFKFINKKKFRFFYKIFTNISYKHPKPLFFRALIEMHEGKLSNDDVTAIVVDVISFMIKFLTISDRDSKDAITMFSNIMNDVYENGGISKDTISYYIATELITKDVTPEKLKRNLASLDGFEQNKNLSVALLALYESTEISDGKVKISYDQAYTLLNSFSDSFSLDHLLVQTPEKDSSNFKYYKDEGTGLLVLKDNHDFPTSVSNGMDYELFTKTVLNRIGNLRIYYRDKNSGRGNTAIELKDYSGFYTYAAIEERSKKLVDIIIDECMPAPNIDINAYKTNSIKKADANLPKMAELMERGLIKEGDVIYNTVVPDTSKATLLNEKYVNFNGEKLTLNEWGCKVTGWKSIRIYAYTAIEGEIETLQDKRLKIINDNI